MLEEADRAFIEATGRHVTAVEHQLQVLKRGPIPVKLVRPCTLGDGVLRLSQEQAKAATEAGQRAVNAGRLTCFVPASGAASRMFKSFVRVGDLQFTDLKEIRRHVAAGDDDLIDALSALQAMDRLAVGLEVERALGQQSGIQAIVRVLLDDLALNTQPKGLVPFHRYANDWRSAAAEHVHEAAALAQDAKGEVRLTMTIPQGHRDAFRRATRAAARRTGLQLRLGLSLQAPSTDTVSLDDEGAPVRTQDGQLLFRPGGHGSLIDNVQQTEADLLAIKNVDNVVVDGQRDAVIRARRQLVGLCAKVQTRVHVLLKRGDLGKAREFSRRWFGRDGDDLRALLDRPLRIVGVVSNDGEPGGGPFWVEGPDGATPQIVERAQLAQEDHEQEAIWGRSTHFNPVDLVCALRDPSGQPYDLSAFIDDSTWMLTRKTHKGVPLLGLERPGLWNGSMAGWNTVFVELPRDTFHPVKTLADLLRPGHMV